MLKYDRNHIVRVVGNVELFWFVFNFLSVLEIKLRASYRLGKHLVADLYIVLVSFCWPSFGGGDCFPLLSFFSLVFSLVRWVTSMKGYEMV